MKVNDATLRLIRRFEGLRLRAYRDAVGVWTIGYGHTSRAGPLPKVQPGMRITRAQAEQILSADIDVFSKRVADAVGNTAMRRLNENQFGALVSFAYNIGLGNFRRSSVLRAVKDGRLHAVPHLLMRWNKARVNGKLKVLRGLTRRRKAEGDLWKAANKNEETAKLRRPPLARDHKEMMATLTAAMMALAALTIAILHQVERGLKWVF